MLGKAANATLKPDLRKLLQKAAAKHGLEYKLLEAIAMVESRGRLMAINHKTRDYGLMQINYHNLKHYKHTTSSIMQPQHNIEVAAQILKQLKRKFGHEPNWVCRYNVGWARNASNWASCKIYIQKLALRGYIETNNKHNVALREN